MKKRLYNWYFDFSENDMGIAIFSYQSKRKSKIIDFDSIKELISIMYKLSLKGLKLLDQDDACEYDKIQSGIDELKLLNKFILNQYKN